MHDIPKLGLEALNNATHYIAAITEDPDEFEMSMAYMDAARKLLTKGKLRQAIAATSETAVDQIQRERDVMFALTEAEQVRRM